MQICESGNPEYNKVGFTWDLITACQYRCSYCYALDWLTNPKSIKKTGEYKQVLSRLSLQSMPDFKIELLGGEPTLHPEIDYILNNLCENNKCFNITVNTNLVSMLNNLQDLARKGLVISCSFHPEQNRDVRPFCKKLMMLHDAGFEKEQLLVNINIHNDISYIDNYIKILKVCSDHNIYAGANYLFDTKLYKSEYSSQFLTNLHERVSELDNIPVGWSMSDIDTCGLSVHRHPGSCKIRFVDNNDVEYYHNFKYVEENNLNKFTGYNCRPKMWQINPNGVIFNDCTGEELRLDNSNIRSLVTCPVEFCGSCEMKYSFHKTAPGGPLPAN